MWNYMNFGVNGQIAVAKSESSLGPFVVVNPVLNITRGSSGKLCNRHYKNPPNLYHYLFYDQSFLINIFSRARIKSE